MRARDARLQLVEEMDRRIGAGVGLQQRDLEILVELLADLGTDECARDRRAGALQASFQLGEPAGALSGRLGLGFDADRRYRRVEPCHRRSRGRSGRRRSLRSLLAEEELADVGVEPVERAARVLACCSRRSRRCGNGAARRRCARCGRRRRGGRRATTFS
jgi:hypothetical protein